MPIRYCLPVLCCLFASAYAAPAPTAVRTATPQYSVEILIFRHIAPVIPAGETWPATVSAPALARAVYPATTATAAYALLAQGSAPVEQTEHRLNANGAYQVIAELGWRQSADATQNVSIAPAAPTTAPVPATGGAGNPPAGLDGTARLQVAGTQTYVTLNLRLCEPAPPGVVVQPPNPATAAIGATTASAAPDEPGVPCFALNQSREVTPGQFEYFDNPIFAALVLVQPLTPPKDAATTPPAASAPAPPHGPD